MSAYPHEYNASHETDCDNDCESHETQPTFLCILLVLLLDLINLLLRL